MSFLPEVLWSDIASGRGTNPLVKSHGQFLCAVPHLTSPQTRYADLGNSGPVALSILHDISRLIPTSLAPEVFSYDL